MTILQENFEKLLCEHLLNLIEFMENRIEIPYAPELRLAIQRKNNFQFFNTVIYQNEELINFVKFQHLRIDELYEYNLEIIKIFILETKDFI